MKRKTKRTPRPPSRIALARLKTGLTQEEVGARLGMKQPSYSAIESGRVIPDAEQAQQLAAILGSTIPELWPVAKKRRAA